MDMVGEAQAELGRLVGGSDPADLRTFAYLHKLDVSWDQCRIILEALTLSLASCETEPNWEFHNINRLRLRPTAAAVIRTNLLPNELHFLRMRLHLSPGEIHAMMKIHPRLSYYPMAMLKRHLNGLQRKLDLSSQELKILIIKYPSVIGYRTEKVEERINFLSKQGKVTCFSLWSLR